MLEYRNMLVMKVVENLMRLRDAATARATRHAAAKEPLVRIVAETEGARQHADEGRKKRKVPVLGFKPHSWGGAKADGTTLH